ncbi:hypothetical protein SpCBS45565_g07076 [Spizellomyces sp. 'palustris']|nr:hypothetical protein SpCBS45565_g07076 [Spizellomyces sp. 'palustris']
MLFRTFLQDIVLASALLLTAHTAQASPVAQAAQCGPGLTPCGPACFRESEGLYHCENGQLKQGPAPSNPPPSNPPSAPVGGAPPANPNGRTIQVVNKCTQDIWIGMQGNPIPRDGGFFLPRGGVENVQVPSKWEAGRMWARTGCTTQSNGRLVCATGDCGSESNGFGIACKGVGGQAPATLAEFTLLDGGRTDFYDLSNVDGHNIGIQIDAFGTRVNNPALGKFNCGNPTCRMDTSKCPAELQMTDLTGHTSCAAIYAAAHNPAQRAKFSALQNIFNNADTLSLWVAIGLDSLVTLAALMGAVGVALNSYKLVTVWATVHSFILGTALVRAVALPIFMVVRRNQLVEMCQSRNPTDIGSCQTAVNNATMFVAVTGLVSFLLLVYFYRCIQSYRWRLQSTDYNVLKDPESGTDHANGQRAVDNPFKQAGATTQEADVDKYKSNPYPYSNGENVTHNTAFQAPSSLTAKPNWESMPRPSFVSEPGRPSMGEDPFEDVALPRDSVDVHRHEYMQPAGAVSLNDRAWR